MSDVGARMHEMQMKYLKSKDKIYPEDSNSYIAGFSSLMHSQFSHSFIRDEADKAQLLAYK